MCANAALGATAIGFVLAERVFNLGFVVSPLLWPAGLLFGSALVGLTGTLDEISATAKSFRAFFQKVPSSGSYTMSHTSSVYLMDGRGTLVSTMSLQDPEDKKIARLRSLLR